MKFKTFSLLIELLKPYITKLTMELGQVKNLLAGLADVHDVRFFKGRGFSQKHKPFGLYRLEVEEDVDIVAVEAYSTNFAIRVTKLSLGIWLCICF